MNTSIATSKRMRREGYIQSKNLNITCTHIHLSLMYEFFSSKSK